ncbi:hypothetical protein CR513_15126, partial [Mucuna pruriens]
MSDSRPAFPIGFLAFPKPKRRWRLLPGRLGFGRLRLAPQFSEVIKASTKDSQQSPISHNEYISRLANVSLAPANLLVNDCVHKSMNICSASTRVRSLIRVKGGARRSQSQRGVSRPNRTNFVRPTPIQNWIRPGSRRPTPPKARSKHTVKFVISVIARDNKKFDNSQPIHDYVIGRENMTTKLKSKGMEVSSKHSARNEFFACLCHQRLGHTSKEFFYK